jgi:hypothetical protein
MKEQMLTLIDHYGLPSSERALHELDLWKRRLRLAFYERNAELAVAAKSNLPYLTPQEWIHFFGARSPFLQWACKPLLKVCCRNLIPKVKKP